MKNNKKKLVQDALLKRATGYDATETVEEFAECDGEIKLVKRRISTKNVPPDVTALKLVLEGSEVNVTELTDEELLKERDRLLENLRDGKYAKS